MAFSDDTITQALARARNRCECSRVPHNWHAGRCSADGFTKGNRGTKWEAHHKVSLDAHGTDTLANCEVLCLKCHAAIPK